MKLDVQKRLAAEVLGVGVRRVWFHPDYLDEISLAIRKEDIRKLISDGIIGKKYEKGISRGRTRFIQKQKKKGQRRGPGSRKGSRNTIISSKRRWINKIRPLRRHLKELKESGKIDVSVYRDLYLKAKGNMFRSVSHLDTYIRDKKLYRK